MTDRYENIRKALAMGPTQGQRKWWEHEDLGYCSVNPVDGGLLIAKCDVRNPFDQEQRANAALITACDPDTIRELLAERDQLAAALEAAREDAEKWRKCNTTHDIGDGERIECHVIVGVNVYNGKDWCGFEQATPDEFFKTLDAIDQARGKEVS